MEFALALFVYPGLLTALLLGLVVGWLTVGLPGRHWGLAALRSADGLVALASMFLVALALVLLPWPYHPAPLAGWSGRPLLLWLALEGAFLLPALPALLARAPLPLRAAVREVQLSLAGRVLLWLAAGALLWQTSGWVASVLPGRLVLLLAGLLAVPVAAGIGVFAPEQSLAPGGAEAGLDESSASLVRLARAVRVGALLALLAVAAVGSAPLPAWGLLLLVVLLVPGAALLYSWLMRRLPRLTLSGGLHWCWWRVLPLALAGVVYLSLIGERL